MELVSLLCRALRDVHVAHLAAVTAVLYLFASLPVHRVAILKVAHV